MRLFHIAILRNDVQPAVQLAFAQDLSTFSFFQRSTVGQYMTFFSQTIAERTKAGQRQDIEADNGGVGIHILFEALTKLISVIPTLEMTVWWVY
jgi:synaptobrevin family protein YKT6